MTNLARKKLFLSILQAVAAIIALNSCAAMRPGDKAVEPVERHRVAILNGGAYRALADQAAMDIASFREIDLVDNAALDALLSRAGKTRGQLMQSRGFSGWASVKGLDFVLELLPSPPAYAAGSVGLRSINWRNGTIKTVPAVKVPERPEDWLLEAQNGWLRFTSQPPGAMVYFGEKLLGQTPLLTMVDKKVFKAEVRWSKKAVKTVEVRADERNWVHVRAPDEYMAKHEKTFYARMQKADEDYGEAFFISVYVVVMLASLALLFYTPFK